MYHIKKYIYYLDILRIIAICLVIFGHSGNYGYMLFTLEEKGSFLYWLYLAFSLLSPISVPIFFMISGVTLLKKDESIQDLFKKRVLRILLVIILFSFLIYMYKLNFDFSQFSIFNFFKTLIIIPVITLFFGIKLFFKNKKPNKFIITLSSCTFGIYLIEHIFRKETENIIIFLTHYLGKLPACFVWIFCILVLSFIIIYICKKVPILKKII